MLRLEGTVVSGFGRGSAELGIPTANLDGDALARSLDGSVSGIFAAFARVFLDDDGNGNRNGHLSKKIFPAVLSVGYNPQFENEHRTCEPWLLAGPGELPRDFRGAKMRLLVACYQRAEAKFESLEKLIALIHEDAEVASRALAELEGEL